MARTWVVTAGLPSAPTQYESSDGWIMRKGADERWYIRTEDDSNNMNMGRNSGFETANRLIAESLR